MKSGPVIAGDLIQPMADTAEAGEISRRLWQELKDYLGELPVKF
jgi:hypothetical protein